MGLLQAVYLSILPAFSRAQELLPCAAGTNFLTVASTANAATLASSLKCSNGTFAVEWFGDVVVSETIGVTQGTSLNITGVAPDATADGNHTTRQFSVDGGSALHLTDMLLDNGNAFGGGGGAVSVTEHSRVTLSGNMTFSANIAWFGGAIYANSSTVSWHGQDTVFRDNHAADRGGAVMTEGSSRTSWDGVTVFVNNSANVSGGAVYVNDSSNLHWGGNTTFEGNAAEDGGAVYAYLSTVRWDGDETTFRENHALWYGGAIMAIESSSISWQSATGFTDNNSNDRGERAVLKSDDNVGSAVLGHGSSMNTWSTHSTRFIDNTAAYGGAIYAQSSTASWSGDCTIFRGNSASDHGGAIMASTSSAISWDGETSFTGNIATRWGGGVYAVDYSNVSWTGTTTFLKNAALDGSGLFMRGCCIGNWSGTTTFESNSAIVTGGGLNVHTSSSACWTGVTMFTGNTADRAGAVWIWRSFVSWDGITTFADNTADSDGGAVYATLAHNIVGRGTTTFKNNTAATGSGGALVLYVDIPGDTTVSDNSVSRNGGAISSAANPRGQHFEDVSFWFNSARVGGAVATFGTGNADECTPSPTMFLRCRFYSNRAIETGGAVETAFGQENFVSCYFESNCADAGGALRLGGNTTIRNCSFVSNLASRSGPAIGVVRVTAVYDSSFHGNTFVCRRKEFLEEVRTEDAASTARYETVCDGCPLWEDCHGCTVSDSEFDPKCSLALEHTSCRDSGSTLNTLSVQKGYWRATSDSYNILPCYNKEACLGGKTGAEAFCDDAYTGAYCSVCKSGYSSSLGFTCTRCSESRRQSLVVITSIAAVLAICALGALSAYLVSTNFEDRKRTHVHLTILRAVPTQAFKTVIVVWQILTQFASVANVTFPGVYQTFWNGIDVINFDLGFIVSAGCIWPGIDFHDRLLASTLWPLAVLGLLVVTYTVAVRRKSASCKMVREKIRNKHLSVMLLLLFFVYSSVSSTVFRMFACDAVDDGSNYLRADYRIMCTGTKHRALQVYAAIMIAVYPVGIPLLYAVLLCRHRVVLSDARANKTAAKPIADLWAPYRPNAFYYEVIECGRRILVTSVAVFMFPNAAAQVAITIMNSLFFFVVSEALSPYASSSDTWLARGGQVIVLFSMYDALLLKIDVSDERTESQHVFAAVLVAGHAIMILAVVVEAIGVCYAASRRKREAEAHCPFKGALRVSKVKPMVQREEKNEPTP